MIVRISVSRILSNSPSVPRGLTKNKPLEVRPKSNSDVLFSDFVSDRIDGFHSKP
jgi:hypothetical protein